MQIFTPIVGSEASFHDTLDHSLKPLPLNVTHRRCLGISKDLQDDLKGKHNFKMLHIYISTD
jgi:hypothetical protein